MLDRLVIKGFEYKEPHPFTQKIHTGNVDIDFHANNINFIDVRAIEMLQFLYNVIRFGNPKNQALNTIKFKTDSIGILVELYFNSNYQYSLLLDRGLADDSFCVIEETLLREGKVEKFYNYLLNGWNSDTIPEVRKIPIVSLLDLVELSRLKKSFIFYCDTYSSLNNYYFNPTEGRTSLKNLKVILRDFYEISEDIINFAWGEIIPSLDLGIGSINCENDIIYMDKKQKYKIGLDMVGSGGRRLLTLLPILLQKNSTVILGLKECLFSELHPLLVKTLINYLRNEKDIHINLLDSNEFLKY